VKKTTKKFVFLEQVWFVVLLKSEEKFGRIVKGSGHGLT
jgi:hypothetical protein